MADNRAPDSPLGSPAIALRVAVLGGGLSGLAAASALVARGADVTVFERGHRPGGRATTDLRDGFVIDSGPHLVSARDVELRRLVVQAGRADVMLPLRPVRLAQLSNGVTERIDPDGARAVRRIPGVAWREGWRVRRLARLLNKFEDILDPHAPDRATRMDDRSVADFVRTYFGETVLSRWVEPLLAADGGAADVAETSRQLFLLHQVQRAFAPVGSLRGGVGALADALAAELDVRLESEVVGVEPAADGFRVAVASAGGEAGFDVDAVVCALPAAVARRVLDPVLMPAERDVLGAGATDPAVVASIALPCPPHAKATRIRVPESEGFATAVVALEPGGARAAAPDGQLLATVVARPSVSRAHLEAPDDVIEKALVGELERVAPESRGAASFVVLRRHRDAYPRFEVGRYRALATLGRVETDRLENGRRLVFAGDHRIGTTLEAAVTAGVRAAERVAR